MAGAEKVSGRQFGILVALFSIGTTILIVPSGLAEEVSQDSWLAAILGVGLGLLLVMLFNAVGSLYPNKSLVEMMETLFGLWIGKAAGLIFVFFTIVTASELIYFTGNFLTTMIMPETPVEAINIVLASVVVMGARLGIETLTRAAEMLFPLFVVLFLVLVIFVSPQIDLDNIKPIMETSTTSLIKASLFFASTFAFTPIVLLMIFPVSVNRLKEGRVAFYTGLLTAGIVLIIIIALCILVLDADTTARQTYPSYSLAKKINVGNFLQRIEIVMAGLWFISMYFKMSCYFYASSRGFAQVMKMKDHRILVFPFGIILVVLSLIVHPNILHSNAYNKDIWLPYVATYGLILPLVLLAIHAIRKFFKKQKSNKST
ncbi:endospore germination permease [Paenibacillus sp. GSMTC-2017]|uniref:GerAB/ArcD/ProY family transporter n=1 Tax=Paenibacillus sp. GSMTC-2017 TaxID=2794350 RepID=UPI0018D906C4|nr:endospore germination permease [Paenibacillus sp. GSMTC-2017]MBH5319755.1 endospore germination permease [Paenibacillus sp. GSMTC-2017]